MTVSFHTLGCKLNFAETSTIIRLFTENGYTKVDFGLPADVTVINTCTVTAQSEKKCRQAIGKAIKTAPHALVVVIGCFAEIKAAEIAAIPGVDLVLGNKEKFDIIQRIQGFKDSNFGILEFWNFGTPFVYERTRSFLKVQDGCDYHCAYCIVPKARGNSRNAPVSYIVEQAKAIATKGIKEIVLTGVNIGDFGKTTGESFLQLLRALEAVENIERIRIGSIEPNLITEEMIEFIAGSQRIAPHFHIPLQSGSNKVLALMGRRYGREQFAEKVDAILRQIPRAAICVDVIVGFPGETDADFEETREFIESLNLAFLHVFTYSERPGTKSVALPNKVSSADARQRSKKLLNLSEIKKTQFYKQNIGQNLKVIFEKRTKAGKMTGFTENYIKVEAPYDSLIIGKMVTVEIMDISESGNMTGLFL